MALARALVSQPKILLLDEPFSSLDLVRRQHFFDVLKKTCADDITLMVVTHDPLDVIGLGAKRVLVIEDGELVEDASFPNTEQAAYASKTLNAWVDAFG